MYANWDTGTAIVAEPVLSKAYHGTRLKATIRLSPDCHVTYS
jgi:hypothetical protein